MKSRRETAGYAFRASLPVMAGYMVLGVGFGILMEKAGYGWQWSVLMSLLIYAGSMQYVAVGLLTGGASLLTSAIMALMVNIRHLFYGITMLEKYKTAGSKKPYLIFALTDETFSLVCSPDLPQGMDEGEYDLWVSLFDHLYWVLGSFLGGLLGSAMTFDTAGIDFAMTALFVVIFVEQWEKAEDHFPAVIGVVTSVLCLLLFGSADFLIPAMLLITLLLLAGKRRRKEECCDG